MTAMTVEALKIAFLVFHALGWCCVAHALLRKTDPRSALGWSAVAVLVPFAGVLLYAVFGIDRTRSRAGALMREEARKLPPYAVPKAGPDSPDVPIQIAQMERLGRNLTNTGLLKGNSVEPLFNGEQAYPAMIEAIDAASERVWLVTYIFNEGKVSEGFYDALGRAAARGVDVRVLVDGIGILYAWRSTLRRLPERGVKLAFFLPPKLLPPNFMINLRNHRKIMICDGVAFTGGMNVADYHVLSLGGAKAAQDVHFRCRGPVVSEFLRLFSLDWGFANGKYDVELPPEISEEAGSCWCRAVVDDPSKETDTLVDLIAGAVSNAARNVLVMTPYFLPTREIAAALRSAAQKGVDVKVILPRKNNLLYVDWASRRVLKGLLDAGVRVFHQAPPFAHTKLLCIDGYYCQIGSANLDPRSLRLNFELNTEVFSADFARIVAGHFESVLARSEETTKEAIEATPLWEKLRNSLCWLFSPYL